ncbi:MAG: acyltransferase [Bacteroidales bacterium]|jgi:peptidoglycan/LPS O-acetylase OafA/YrhL|nr:acyltransferase [Bacteroidales bacterium]
MTKKRDLSVDLLKTIAAILIVNSHAEVLYPDSIRALATGGGIGDSLFFYCSGLLLFGTTAGFGFLNWYKKRINRIFPVVFGALIISSVFNASFTIPIANLFFIKGAWFVSCIMIYYAAYYFIDHYFPQYFIHIAIVVFALSWLWFVVENANAPLQVNASTNKIGWLWYFISFLAGAYSGKIAKLPKIKLWISIPAFFICVGLYYFFHGAYLSKWHNFQLFLVPALTATSMLARIIVSGNGKIQALLEKYPAPFRAVSTLTLNIYLLHTLTFNFCKEIVFPLNILAMYVATFGLAYLLQIFVNFFIQTMNKNSVYDWRAMIKLC